MGDSAAAGKPQQAPYDREVDWQTSAEILSQARWLFEQHEKRTDSAQKAAATVIAATGAVVSFAPKALPARHGTWEAVLLGLVLTAGLVTVVLCVVVLKPREREKGMPSIAALRKFAKRHDDAQCVPLPPSQFAVDMLNAKDLNASSPLDHAAKDANERMEWLTRAYFAFALMFALTMVAAFAISA
ncbi:hypothetical protein BN10_20013 [Phycicoccus elongatus Lp2]|uniref:Pycsar effector protein domain-containing protein n=1 Tax=Phycicoccus elongatus Lp2 TaxID=1193181 RepID=N0E3T9_9MICO|nr:hypothetical protein [Phycicoccus elongatus]CCH69549.1 hypothetical protein BN10_20013 [Phycicoccus elongatus Lp2]